MKWSEAMKQAIVEELKEYEVYFSLEEVPETLSFPKQWLNFGPAESGKRCTPDAWRHYAEWLPWVSTWVDNCVLGTVLAVRDKPFLMYVFSGEGNLYFYMGGAPLGEGSTALEGREGFPDSLKKFYGELHNGFGFYIGCTMGPSQVEQFVSIKDLCDEDYPDLPDMTAIFSSGAGDYLALGEGAACGEVFIWWHEKPDEPARDLDLWAYMDSWMSIFLEDSDVCVTGQEGGSEDGLAMGSASTPE